jgi:predicted regulator of Ras-like GTPase activity (Roadblock/LC7/MglB family)
MVAGCDERELLAWRSRSLTGCLYDFQRNTEAMCALIVQDDAAILAKVTTDENFDLDTLGAFSSMMFATARMVGRELGTDGEVLGDITIGTAYHLLVMGIIPQVALVTLCRNSFAKGLLRYQARAMIPRMIECLGYVTTENR